jgi:hypothetical protein
MDSRDFVEYFRWASPRLSLLFGLGFLAANLRLFFDLLQYRRRRQHALLTWEGVRPKYYGINLGLGVVFGLLLAVNVFWLHRPLRDLFGELMMLTYYGYAFPFSVRIARGFYEDGVWSDSGFMKWGQISAVTWKEEGSITTLVLISHFRNIAKRLDVPGQLYGQARRLLRDRIKSQEMHMGGAGLDLGSREEQDVV